MFDELIDTPCGYGGGHGDLPLSLLHSHHSGVGDGGLVDAGAVLELGTAGARPRGDDAGHLIPVFGRSAKKTLRIREPSGSAGAGTGVLGSIDAVGMAWLHSFGIAAGPAGTADATCS